MMLRLASSSWAAAALPYLPEPPNFAPEDEARRAAADDDTEAPRERMAAIVDSRRSWCAKIN